ncbi:hypothetical protein [Legionella brunensis]|uniref:Leucine-rich repeat-containing protein n=1 Tax=Legionella brunensis TaxID=29422 RepID=A0A0W0SNM2_9GAMM|nr:hypothetical protein [Legionella brunensis]KTC84968.1 leucine-rich repeat-containing protein [Legionella brunensis]
MKIHLTQFSRKPAIALIDPVSSLDNNITYLDLSDNYLGSKITGEIVQVLANIPPQISGISLRWNRLAKKSSDELIQILQAIPQTVTSLNLRGNCLHCRTKGYLAAVLASITENITHLDISLHEFSSKDVEELIEAFSAIPATVSSLNLSLTGLNKLPVDSIKKLNNTLPNVRTIYLGYGEILSMSPAQRDALKDVFPNVKNVIFVDPKGNEIGGSDLRANANLVRGLGFKAKEPSLLSLCTFFVKHSPDMNLATLPIEVRERVLAC